MLDRLNQLSPGGKLLLLVAAVGFAILAGWLGYQVGFALGSN